MAGKLGARVVHYALRHREGGAEAHPPWFSEMWELYDKGLADVDELAAQTRNSMMLLHYRRTREDNRQ